MHGNEISSCDAALALAYHLLAAQGDAEVEQILRESIVLIDPSENPDGRARFLASNRSRRRPQPPIPSPCPLEHDEPWPGGRSNHYLFDLNRDWFALSQPESRGRVRVFLDWFPQVTADLHEMGGDSTYFFAPPADPLNPYLTAAQKAWWQELGQAIAGRFDARGFPYFVREVFDSFYPGYGESWPLYQGAIGMTFEQGERARPRPAPERRLAAHLPGRHRGPLHGRPHHRRHRRAGAARSCSATSWPTVARRWPRPRRRRCASTCSCREPTRRGPRAWPTSWSPTASRCGAPTSR